MAPREGGALHVPRDRCQCVVVAGWREASLGFACVALVGSGGAPPALPLVLRERLLRSVCHVVEHRLLRHLPRAAFRQVRAHFGVRDRRIPLAVRAAVSHVESQRGAVEVDVDRLPMTRRRRVDLSRL